MKAPALAAAKVPALGAAKGVPPRVPGMVSAEVIRAYREALAKGQSKASALLFARQAAGAAIGKAAVAPKASPLIIEESPHPRCQFPPPENLQYSLHCARQFVKQPH